MKVGLFGAVVILSASAFGPFVFPSRFLGRSKSRKVRNGVGVQVGDKFDSQGRMSLFLEFL